MSDFSRFCQTVFQSDCVETLLLQFILVSLWDYSLNSSFEGTLHVPSITLKVNVLLETSSGRTEAHEPEAGLKPQPPSFECVTARTLGACVCRALCWGDGGDRRNRRLHSGQRRRKVTWRAQLCCPSFLLWLAEALRTMGRQTLRPRLANKPWRP